MSNYIDIKDPPYNAVGDGVADDSTAISSAIAAAITANVPAHFPAGTYLINSTVTITGSDVKIEGNGATVRYLSAAGTPNNGFTIASTSRRVAISGLCFQGDNNDDWSTNYGAAIQINDDVTDIDVHACRFEQAGSPIQASDSFTTRRLKCYRNYFHNSPNGIHPPSDSTVEDCDFVCDAVVSTRAQAVYSYGQQTNLTILNCRFRNIYKEDIQIRAAQSRFNERSNFRIIGCHFENSNDYSIWAGSDEAVDIGEIIITGNTFKNCHQAVNLDGARSAVVSGNHFEYNWEYPTPIPAPLSGGNAISVEGAIGLSGQYNNTRGVVISGNKMIHRHPWVAFVSIDTVPANNDTITIGDFVYTWKTTTSADGDVQIAAGDTVGCATNLVSSMRGLDGRATAPCDVLRYLTDAFSNPNAASYGETNGNIVVIASWLTFTFSKSSSHITLTGPTDYRSVCDYGITVNAAIAPLIEGNEFDDFTHGIGLTRCFAPTVRNNVLVDHGYCVGALVTASGNVHSHYSGNRTIEQNPFPTVNLPNFSTISDGFPVIEDPYVLSQQLTNKSLYGRSGIVPVGDGKASTYLYYGSEIASPLDGSTLPWRWAEGDLVSLYDGSVQTNLIFKRSSPGALQFNSPDSLITLINAVSNFSAAYAAYVDDRSAGNPKLMIKIKAAATGTAGNAYRVYTIRFAKPSYTAFSSAYLTVPQPLITGQLLRTNAAGTAQYALLYGGAATLIKTFVMSPIANPDRGVFVQGVDATSQALNPVVYQADIISGVGFTITHAVAAGTESFFFRVN